MQVFNCIAIFAIKIKIMKKFIFITLLLSTAISCKDNNAVRVPASKSEYASFGKKITSDDCVNSQEVFEKYKALKTGDTLAIKIASKSKAVCQKKGCWMTLELPENKEIFVKFKDYSFFVPTNAQKTDMIVDGKAFVSVESVDELKHYAKDEGKSQADIDRITKPRTTYSFLADGVLIKK